jgi:hypothetical protein
MTRGVKIMRWSLVTLAMVAIASTGGYAFGAFLAEREIAAAEHEAS